MDMQHRDSNPGRSEASKRPLSASAQKESQKEHAQKAKVSMSMASVEPQALFGGTPAGSVHAPPMEAALTTTSNEKGGPLRLPPQNNTAQQPAPQRATVHPSAANGSPLVPAQQQISHLASRVFTRAQVHISRVERHVSTIRPLTCCKLPPRTLGHGDTSVILISLVLQHPSAAMDNLHGNCWQLLMYITRCTQCSRKGATASNSHLAVPSAAAAFSGCCAKLVLHLSLLLP